ncbi:NAD(P)-dependent oxidoreductase [Ruegeria atlantica]|uniref:NAD(P)-dependent oxidoreductase n=1 Tax=Ruegeria atlantica TaxID=81569 RepID=UPI0034A02525
MVIWEEFSMTDISVIGLGSMGKALARAQMKAGRSVTVWNRTPEKATALGSEGATVAATVSEAISASPVTITCVKSHPQTIELLSNAANSLPNKTIIELSTGGAEDAEDLAQLVENAGASWMVGIINAYPHMIGDKDTVLSVVGTEEQWKIHGPIIRNLGGRSVHVGDQAGMLAALFAGLFTVRQGFMWGMIYGALAAKKAGIPMQTFSDLVPISMGMMKPYYDYFAATAPQATYGNPPASMSTYAAALEDVLASFEALGARDELPRLFVEMAQLGMDQGLEDKALTAIIDVLAQKQ